MTRQLDAALFVDLESAAGGHLSLKRFSAQRLLELVEQDFDAKLRVAGAYADFRHYTGYIEALHLTGIEPVQVTGYRKGQQSVDMKICCDVLSTAFERPEIGVFIILANDTDYVPLVRVLRKLGRSVFFLCKKNEIIERAYGAFCDRIVDYGMLLDSLEEAFEPEAAEDGFESGVSDDVPVQSDGFNALDVTDNRTEEQVGDLLRSAQTALIDLLKTYPEGIFGGRLLPQLRDRLGMPTFDFSDVGYASALKFARSLPSNEVAVEHGGQSDFKILAAGKNSERSEEEVIDWIVRNSALHFYLFSSDPNERNAIISAIANSVAICGNFTRRELVEDVVNRNPEIGKTKVDKYFNVLLQTGLFDIFDDSSPKRFKSDNFKAPSAILCYEAKMVQKALFFLSRSGRLEDWNIGRQLAMLGHADTEPNRERAEKVYQVANDQLIKQLNDA